MKYYDAETPAPDLTECFSRPGDQELLVDVFLPDSENANKAAVLFVHGGGWRMGSRDAFLWHAHRLSLFGYVSCTIDYRLTDTAVFPAAVEDCQAGVRWLRENAKRFTIDPERIGVMGSSAGGHLVACLGVMENEEKGTSAKANCVVDVHGVHDFVSIWEETGELNPYWVKFLGGPISEKKEEWIAASPALHVTENSAPMLLVHDPDDPTVPSKQSHLMVNALMEAGCPVQFLPTPGSGHGFVYSPENEWTPQVWPSAVAWLDHHLLDADEI
jgi:acetyl esterase/lipase